MNKLELLKKLIPLLERCAGAGSEGDWRELARLIDEKAHVRLVPRGCLRDISEAVEARNVHHASAAFCRLLSQLAYEGPREALQVVVGTPTAMFMH